MGLECLCGVRVDAQSFNNSVKFVGQRCPIKGNLSYHANVCVSTLETSFLSLDFEDEETLGGVNSFLFVANEITSVECCKHGNKCEVTVKGTGVVNHVEHPFVAVFIDKAGMGNVGLVKYFVISGFFDQNGAVVVPPGSIVALGCD